MAIIVSYGTLANKNVLTMSPNTTYNSVIINGDDYMFIKYLSTEITKRPSPKCLERVWWTSQYESPVPCLTYAQNIQMKSN